MTRSIIVGEVRTGRRITQIPVADASWSMVHRGIGTVDVDIPLGASDFAALERRLVGQFPGPNLWPSANTFPQETTSVWRPGQGLRREFLSGLDPARCFLAVLEDDVVLEAGPIWAHDYNAATGMLKVKAAGLRSLFDHRFVMGVIASGVDAAAWSATYSGLSLGTIAKRLIQLAMSHTGGNLPIVMPADEAGASERTYYGYDLGVVGQRLDELMGVINGPDIALEPRLTADRMGVEWVLRVGTEADPLLYQAGGDHVWDARVPRGGVSGISVTRDATNLAARSWVTGSGMESALLMEYADDMTLVDVGFPLTETRESRGSIEDRTTAARWASGNLDATARPWQSWKFTVRAGMSPRLGSYRPGDFARVWIPEQDDYLSLLLPKGSHRARVLQVSGGMGDEVAITLVPLMESR